MESKALGPVESQFANIIWEHEPLYSRELVALCEQKLSWKKPTTYTVLRKLIERGMFQNRESIVTSRISRSDFYMMQGEELVKDAFAGSFPAFVKAYMKRNPLSEEDIREIEKSIRTAKQD